MEDGQHPSAPQRTRPTQIDAEERRWKALELRKKRLTFRQIGKRLGCSYQGAHQMVCAALDELAERTKQSAEQLRAIELAGLDDVEQRCRKKLVGANQQDTAKLAATIVKIAESRRKLLGMDAPQKVEMTGNLYTVQGASPDCDEWGKPRKDAGHDVPAMRQAVSSEQDGGAAESEE